MITRQKLLEIKTQTRGGRFTSDAAMVVHTLVDNCLELIDKVDGGAPQRDWAVERAVADKQVRLALDDLKKVLSAPLRTMNRDAGDDACDRGRYIVNCIDQMLRAKTAWAREWSYYQPRIEEEFGV